MKGCESRLGESSKRSRHLTDTVEGFAVSLGRSRDSQPDVRLEKMSTDFFTRGLQVVFTFMLSAGRGFEAGSRRLFGSASDQAENPREQPPIRFRDAAGVVTGQSVMMAEENTIKSFHAINCLMTASWRRR